ncbi:MAG: hypothetical protein ACYTF1_17065 [Planctomycetota bacterium]
MSTKLHNILFMNLLLVICVCSCDSNTSYNDPASRLFWISQWEKGLGDLDHLSQRYKQSARNLVEELKKSKTIIDLRLLDVLLAYDNNKKEGSLAVFYYDESGTVSGFCIKEYDNNDNLLIEEKYEVYPQGTKGFPYASDIIVPIQRRGLKIRKDESEWITYKERGEVSRDLLPPIYVSIPSRERKVAVSLINLKGNESTALELFPPSPPRRVDRRSVNSTIPTR